MKRRTLLVDLAAAVITVLGAALPASAQNRIPQRPPNIVLILTDDLGYGDLGVYGHPTIRTPNLDRLAAEGVRLTSYYAAAPVCSPSRVGLLTGRYGIRSRITGALMPESKEGLSTTEVTIATLLKRVGYRTGMTGKWHMGVHPGSRPLDHGFDSYLGLLYSNDMIKPWVQTDVPLRLYRGNDALPGQVDNSTLTATYTDEALRFLRETDPRPFFLYVAHSMPHVPLGVGARFAGKSAGGRYGDVIEEIDWSTGRILDELKALGLDQHTLVVFTSDNGPWLNMPPRMLVNEKVVQTDAGSPGPLRGSKGTAWEAGVRVPLVARWPGRIPAGSVGTDLAAAMDVFVTLAEAAGAKAPADRPLDGSSIRALLEGKGPTTRHEFFYFPTGRLEAVRDTRWKLILNRKDSASPAVAELYDMALDPYERADVADAHPDVVARLLGRLRAFAKETGASIDAVAGR